MPNLPIHTHIVQTQNPYIFEYLKRNLEFSRQVKIMKIIGKTCQMSSVFVDWGVHKSL